MPTPSFVVELPLVLAGADERILHIRFDCARQAYNALLREGLRRLALLRQSRALRAAQAMPKHTKAEKRTRNAAFRALDQRFGLGRYDLEPFGRTLAASWIGDHLDGEVIRALAARASNAIRHYQVGTRGRPRFKGKNHFHSVECKSNKTGIRWRNGVILWKGLTLRVRVDADDPLIAHALASRVKFVRLVRRTLNRHTQFIVQLVCEGKPYQKPKNLIGEGIIGIDPGPRTFGIAGANWGAQVDLATPLKLSHRQQRLLQRKIDRQRRANNPDNVLPNGQYRTGRKTWHISNNQRVSERQLAEAKRKETAHRRSLHGQLVNAILRLGNDIRVERNSYRSFQKTYGKSVGLAAPATFIDHLMRKAESAGARVEVIPASLRLSQTCICGTIVRKELSERIHRCSCGISVQRDVFSAWLARSAVAVDGPDGPSWRLDAAHAQQAWADAESRLPMASSPICVPALAAWARQSTSDHPHQDVRPPFSDGGPEWIVGAVGPMVREGLDVVAHDVPLEQDRESQTERTGLPPEPAAMAAGRFSPGR